MKHDVDMRYKKLRTTLHTSKTLIITYTKKYVKKLNQLDTETAGLWAGYMNVT